MALIFADFKNIKKVYSHVGDNIIYCIQMCNIRDIIKQSFIGKLLLRIKWKFELTLYFKHGILGKL